MNTTNPVPKTNKLKTPRNNSPNGLSVQLSDMKRLKLNKRRRIRTLYLDKDEEAL